MGEAELQTAARITTLEAEVVRLQQVADDWTDRAVENGRISISWKQRAEVAEVCRGWISIKEQQPDHSEPIVYARPKSPGKWSVGIAYWTVSEKWMPEMECEKAPAGFTHWKPLGAPPSQEQGALP